MKIVYGALALSFCLFTTAALGQNYPAKSIKVIIGVPVGGPTDFMARTIFQRISEGKGWKFVLENRPGGTGIIPNNLVAKSAPDGYTLLVSPGAAITIAPHLYSKMPYETDDLVPVVKIATFPLVLVSSLSFQAKTVKELIGIAKTRPGAFTFGSVGVGSPLYMAGEIFNSSAGVEILHVPFQGAGPALNDLLGGHIDMMFNNIGIVKPYIDSGKLHAIAVTGGKRNNLLPEVPTIRETLPSYKEINIWSGIFVPKGTQSSVIRQLNSEVVSIFNEPRMLDLWKNNGMDFVPNTPEKFSAQVNREYRDYGDLVRRLGIKQE